MSICISCLETTKGRFCYTPECELGYVYSHSSIRSYFNIPENVNYGNLKDKKIKKIYLKIKNSNNKLVNITQTYWEQFQTITQYKLLTKMISWNCNGCSKPLLANTLTNKTNEWMHRAVVIDSDKIVIQGIWDGYTLVGANHTFTEPCVWHKACWIIGGMSKAYVPSSIADDATGFYEEGDLNDFWKEKEPKR